MPTVVVTPPDPLPVTLEEAKVQCRVLGSDHDDRLTALLEAAIAHVEHWTGKALGTQTLRTFYDAFSTALQLPRGPVQSISSVKYYDEYGVEQTASSSLYVADMVSDPAWVVLASDQSWPATLSRANGVSIQYVAGFAEVPADMKMAVLMLVEAWFDGRDEPKAVEAQLRSYRPVLV